MKIGTSGSRVGTTTEQRIVYTRELVVINATDPITEVHDGNCFGWDNEAAFVAALFGYHRVVHPCDITEWQMSLDPDTVLYNNWEIRPVKRPLIRNHDIVVESDIMFCVPANPEKPDSLQGKGTWTTIMYAHNMGREYRIISPDGSIRDKI
jgi:hypothetical protein